MGFLSDAFRGTIGSIFPGVDAGGLSSVKSVLLGSKPKAVVESRDTLQGSQQTALAEALSQLSKPTTPSNTFTSSLAGMEKLALGGGTVTGMQQGDTALTDALSGRPSLIDSTYKASVEDPTLRTLNEQLLPTISREFGGGSNLFSSERNAAIDNASRTTMEALIRERAAMQFQAEEAAKTRALAALESLNTARNSQAGMFSALLNGSTTMEQLNLERLKAILAGATAGTKDTVGIGLPGQEGLLQGFVSGFGSGLGKKAG
jgi:hypothetical protein